MAARRKNQARGLPEVEALVRPSVKRLHAYVPGEQPKVRGLVKLNTNENPCPPSPKVLEAVKGAVDERLRLYPDPPAQPLREKLAKLHGCGAENVIVGNGSDELLALATRAFVEPRTGQGGAQPGAPGHLIQYFVPSYSLYPVLAEIHNAAKNEVPLSTDFALPSVKELKVCGQWEFEAALTYVTTPNAPSGRGYPTDELEKLCAAQRGVTVLDEAYVDFAEEDAMELALRYPHVLVSRTFSKSYSLCFQRVGYFVGHPVLIGALDKIRDSYNVNGLGQVAALATLKDLSWYRKNFRAIKERRDSTAAKLEELGFEVLPSQTNFLMVRPPRYSAERWYREWRERKILVRWFDRPDIREFLRITIGGEREMAKLLRMAWAIAKG